MKYKSMIVTKVGGPEVLQVVEKELRPPCRGEARIRILAASLVQDDVAARVGNRPVLPKPPFVPGYACLGLVDAVGEGVSSVAIGERVAALTTFGSYAEYLYWKASELVPVGLIRKTRCAERTCGDSDRLTETEFCPCHSGIEKR